MPDAPTAPESTPATEAASTAAASPIEASASPSQTETAPQTPSVDMDAWIRGTASSRMGPALNPGGVVPTAELTSETASDDPAAQSGADVTADDQTPPDGQQAQPGRRAKAAQADKDRIAELEARVSEYEAPTYRDRVRQELLAEDAQKSNVAQSQADAERFTQSLRMPDSDPRLYEIVPGTNQTLYDWREEQKELLARYPQAQEMYDRLVTHERQALYTDLEQKQAAFWASVEADMDAVRSLPGVDVAAVQQAKSFSARDRLLHAAGAASKEGEYAPKVAALEARVKELSAELDDARLGNLGRSAAPFSGGTSAGAHQNFDMDAWIRGVALGPKVDPMGFAPRSS